MTSTNIHAGLPENAIAVAAQVLEQIKGTANAFDRLPVPTLSAQDLEDDEDAIASPSQQSASI